MSGFLTTASLLTCGVGLAHSYLGERYLLRRLLRRDLPRLLGSEDFTARTLRFAWHLTTVAWFGLAAIMWSQPGRPVLLVVGWTFAISAVITLVASRGRHLAWIVFALIALCCWLAQA